MYKQKSAVVFSLMLMVFGHFGVVHAQGHQASVSAAISASAVAGESFEALILLVDSDPKQNEANSRPDAQMSTLGREAFEIKIREKQEKLANLKIGLLEDTTVSSELEVISDYSALPIMHIRIRTQVQLDRLARDARVIAIEEIIYTKTNLTQSLSLIGQPAAAAAGFTGAGTAVCVLDTGLDYTSPAFGGCTTDGAGQPTGSNCKVAYVQDFAPNDSALDADGHGTNVAGIVSGVAPGSKMIGLDVFNGTSASSADITNAINWCITNKAAYNIVSLNMSLGNGVSYPNPVPTTGSAWGTAITTAKNFGIGVIAAAGNEASTTGVSLPAAYSGVVSVGAVYDANLGSINWRVCSDPSTAADKVTCFSNSAYYLSLLAPGSSITAAGITQSGTSQASPHVAGAWAVLKQKAPAATVDEVLASLATSGVPVLDARNGITKPRISVYAALDALAPGVSNTRLSNISTRGQVQTGDNVMIGGFIIDGATPKTVLIRARGPSLSAYNVPGVLLDPYVELFSGQNRIASNDNWGSAPNASAITATGMAPTYAAESAILTTLAPGAYTVIVRGVNNTSGVGIVEVLAQ